jgi:hypothetical protein
MSVIPQSRYAGLLPIEPSEDFFRPIDLKPEPIDLKPEHVPVPNWQPSARRRPRAPARFLILIAFCTGVATTLLWQSYGDAAREMIANLYSQLDWLAPRPALTAQNHHTADVIAPAATSAEQLNAMSIDLDVDVDTATNIAADREPTTRSTDQTAATGATGIPVESRTEGHSGSRRSVSTEIRPRGDRHRHFRKEASSCLRRVGMMLPAPRQLRLSYKITRGGWPTWTLRAPGHEGTMWPPRAPG